MTHTDLRDPRINPDIAKMHRRYYWGVYVYVGGERTFAQCWTHKAIDPATLPNYVCDNDKRCEDCWGHGENYTGDMWVGLKIVPCDTCGGRGHVVVAEVDAWDAPDLDAIPTPLTARLPLRMIGNGTLLALVFGAMMMV